MDKELQQTENSTKNVEPSDHNYKIFRTGLTVLIILLIFRIRKLEAKRIALINKQKCLCIEVEKENSAESAAALEEVNRELELVANELESTKIELEDNRLQAEITANQVLKDHSTVVNNLEEQIAAINATNNVCQIDLAEAIETLNNIPVSVTNLDDALSYVIPLCTPASSLDISIETPIIPFNYIKNQSIQEFYNKSMRSVILQGTGTADKLTHLGLYSGAVGLISLTLQHLLDGKFNTFLECKSYIELAITAGLHVPETGQIPLRNPADPITIANGIYGAADIRDGHNSVSKFDMPSFVQYVKSGYTIADVPDRLVLWDTNNYDFRNLPSMAVSGHYDDSLPTYSLDYVDLKSRFIGMNGVSKYFPVVTKDMFGNIIPEYETHRQLVTDDKLIMGNYAAAAFFKNMIFQDEWVDDVNNLNTYIKRLTLMDKNKILALDSNYDPRLSAQVTIGTEKTMCLTLLDWKVADDVVPFLEGYRLKEAVSPTPYNPTIENISNGRSQYGFWMDSCGSTAMIFISMSMGKVSPPSDSYNTGDPSFDLRMKKTILSKIYNVVHAIKTNPEKLIDIAHSPNFLQVLATFDENSLEDMISGLTDYSVAYSKVNPS